MKSEQTVREVIAMATVLVVDDAAVDRKLVGGLLDARPGPDAWNTRPTAPRPSRRSSPSGRRSWSPTWSCRDDRPGAGLADRRAVSRDSRDPDDGQRDRGNRGAGPARPGRPATCPRRPCTSTCSKRSSDVLDVVRSKHSHQRLMDCLTRERVPVLAGQRRRA